MAKDKLKVTGTFHCKVYKHGKLIQEYTDKNLVVSAGLEYLAKKLAGVSTLFDVTKIGVGEGISAPDMGNTALTNDTFYKNITTTSFVPSDSVDFVWSLAPGDANGITITEFGLCFSNNTLFARKIGLTIAKDPTISVAGTWTIKFSS